MRKRIAEGQGTLIRLIVQLLFIGIFIVSSALSRNFETVGQKAMYGFGILSLLLLLAYAVWRLMQRRPEIPGKKRRALWVSTAVISMVLAALTSATFVDDIHTSTVEIWCGEKNPLSQGAEVWLSGYQIAGESQNMQDLRIEESQNIYYNAENDNYVYSDVDGSGEGYLRISVSISSDQKAGLTFIQHPWSGIIKVSQNGEPPVEIDLYSKVPTSRGYTLAVAPSEHVVVSYLIEAIVLLIGKFSLFQVILYSFALGIAGLLHKKSEKIRDILVELKKKSRHILDALTKKGRHILDELIKKGKHILGELTKKCQHALGKLLLALFQLLLIGIFIVGSALSRNFETVEQKAMYGFGIVSLLLLLAYAVWRLMQRRPEIPGKNRRALWVSTAVISMVLVALTSATFVDDIHASTVEIWCGEKNPLSQGAEVWLSGYQIAGKSQNMRDLRIEESQNVYYNAENDNYVYSDMDGSGEGYLRIRINPGKKVRLIFIQHSWSGIIKVSQNGEPPVEIDLYSKEPTSRGYALAVAPSEHVVFSYLMEAIVLLIGKFSLFQVILYSFALGIAGLLQVKKSQRTLGGLLFAGGILLPSPILLALFVQNANYIDFPLVLLLCLIAAVLLSFLWAAVYLVTRSALASYIGCVVATVFLFGSGALMDVLPNSWDTTGSYSMWLCIGIAAVLLLIVIAVFHGKAAPVIVNSFAAIFTAIFLLMNIVPSVGIYIKQRSAAVDSNTKQDFIVDQPSDEPNVYWIHCDGMLGFSSVEKYFGDGQEEVKQKLVDRGFVINENATFEAGHSTSACVPALMCPDFYDENMMKLIESCKGDSTLVRYGIADEAYQRLLSEQRYYNETTMAFSTAGFQTVNILAWNWGGGGGYFPPNTDMQFCCMNSNIVELIIDKEKTLKTGAQFSGGAFAQLEDFVEKTMYPFKKIMDQIDFSGLEDLILESSAEKRIVSDEVLKDPLYPQVTQCIIPALQNSQSPRFCILAYAQAHRPFIYNEQGEKIAENNENPVDYLPQHKYAVKVIFNAVDTILAADPDAVIVLQADHGLHGNSEKEFKEAFGDDAVVSELWNQVFSAIRVPEKYQNGDEIYAYTNPLNISRYLINNFVGEGNYEYLEAS